MIERMPESPAFGETNRHPESAQATIDDRLFQVFGEMRQPLYRQDVRMLAEADDFGAIHPGSLATALKRMLSEGVIIKIERGVYSLPEFADEEYESQKQVTKEAKLLNLLNRAKKPMHLEEIGKLAESEDYETEDLGRIDAALQRMIRKEIIVRVERGVYLAPGFASEEYELPKLSMNSRLKVALAQAKKSLPVQDIISRAEKDGSGALNPTSVHSALHKMSLWGEVIRTNRGSYCLPELADKEYEPPEKTISERAETALWHAGQPLHWQEIHRLAETDDLGTINLVSLPSKLNEMVHNGLLVRLEPGTFSLPEFAYASDKNPDLYIGKVEVTSKIIQIIAEAGGSASSGYIYLELTDSNLGVLSLKNISSLLNRIAQDNEPKSRIIRTKENIYCLTDLAETEYETPIADKRSRLLVAFGAASRPLHYQEMHQLIEQDGLGVINTESTRSILSCMVNEGLIIRVESGVYSLPEFTEEYYELPRLNIETRIIAVLEDARQPLHHSKIDQLVNSDSQDKVGQTSIHTRLIEIANLGILARPEPGIYSLPEFAEEEYETPKPTLTNRLISVFRQNRRPLDFQEIYYTVSRDGWGTVDQETAYTMLAWITKEGTVLKLARGIYSLPEFAKEEYKPLNPSIGMRTIAILKKARRPLHSSDIHRLVNSESGNEIRLGSLRVELFRLDKRGKIIKTERGVYSLPEFVQSQTGKSEMLDIEYH